VSVGHSRRTTSVQSSSSPYGVNRPSGAVSISESGKSNTGRSTSHHRRCSVIMRSSAGRSTLWAAVGAVPRASTPTLLCSPEPGAWLVAKARAEARDAQPDVDSNPFAPSSDDGIELVKCSETFGCLAVMSGRSAAQRQVARILSHTSSKTSQRYSRTGAIHKHSAPLTKRPTQLTNIPRPADKSTPSGGHDQRDVRTCGLTRNNDALSIALAYANYRDPDVGPRIGRLCRCLRCRQGTKGKALPVPFAVEEYTTNCTLTQRQPRHIMVEHAPTVSLPTKFVGMRTACCNLLAAFTNVVPPRFSRRSGHA
jgi:hypothetical protein